ncbi:MAG: histidine phosphatase family protein [Paracoccaceae bacterium]|jgi:phosphohistidine phosphatase|nr:histidine phosphatase family protein [Paracoccaceae bacterium]
MKHLILLRHAKSSWNNPELDDLERPLNKRGKRASGDLAKWFRRQGWAPDEVLCSPALRTRETLERLKLDATPEIREDIYEAPPGALFAALQGAAGETVMMVGHNPGIGALAQILARQKPNHPRFDDYPTGALTILRFDLGDWAGLQPGSGEVVEFLTPHDLALAD